MLSWASVKLNITLLGFIEILVCVGHTILWLSVVYLAASILAFLRRGPKSLASLQAYLRQDQIFTVAVAGSVAALGLLLFYQPQPLLKPTYDTSGMKVVLQRFDGLYVEEFERVALPLTPQEQEELASLLQSYRCRRGFAPQPHVVEKQEITIELWDGDRQPVRIELRRGGQYRYTCEETDFVYPILNGETLLEQIQVLLARQWELK